MAAHCFPDYSFIAGVLLQRAAGQHGIEIAMNDTTGNTEKCVTLFEGAGFEDIVVEV